MYTALSNRNKSINFISFVLHRWLRYGTCIFILTIIFSKFLSRFSPTVLATMCCLLLWPKFGNGPFFHSENIDFITEPCYQNWWLSFTYLANWYPSDQVVSNILSMYHSKINPILILVQCNALVS